MEQSIIDLAEKVYLQNLQLFCHNPEYRTEIHKKVLEGEGDTEEVIASDAITCAKSFYKKLSESK